MNKKENIFEFPEDDKIVHVDLKDYTTLLMGGSSEKCSIITVSKKIPNSRFLASVLVTFSVAVFIIFSTYLIKFSGFLGSLLVTFAIIILREWNRVYGMLLTRAPRASIDYASVMKEQKEYIPFYDMEWLTGKRYRPYYFGCNGPLLNTEMDDRTPNNEESNSPKAERGNKEVLQK